MADVRSKAERVFTNYFCYKIDPLWRRLPVSERQLGSKEFRAALHETSGRVAVRSYLTTGFREDIDFFLWFSAKTPSPFRSWR
jgi:chlorite dismutase